MEQNNYVIKFIDKLKESKKDDWLELINKEIENVENKFSFPANESNKIQLEEIKFYVKYKTFKNPINTSLNNELKKL